MTEQDHKLYTLKNLGPMADMLLRICPPDHAGVKSIPTLARRLGLSPYAVYKWIYAQRIPPAQVSKLLEVAEGRVSRDELLDYVI